MEVLLNHKNAALQIFRSAIDAVKPDVLMQRHLHTDGQRLYIGDNMLEVAHIDQLIVIGAGKAAASMCLQAEQQLGDLITRGICVTKYGHGLPLKKIKLLEAGHPIPDQQSLLAGDEILQLLQNVTAKDVVLVLLTGGASALMEVLPESISLDDVQQVIHALIRSGASIHEINTVRKKLSKVKGGGLGKAAFPAAVHTLILSDVVGDNLDVIASGPTVDDPTSFEDAMLSLNKYNLWQAIPRTVKAHLEDAMIKHVPDALKTNGAIFKNCFTKIIGSNTIALQAASKEAEKMGYHTSIFKENTTDNTDQLARSMIKELMYYNGPLPACFVTGGETTVEVKESGKGGRNQHFVLCALDEIINCPVNGDKTRLTVLSAGSDGSDGPTDATGAVVEPANFIDLQGIRQEIRYGIENFDSYHFFEKYDALIKTGPTETNVMDIMVVLISANKN